MCSACRGLSEITLMIFFACVTSRVSPRQATHFLLLRQEKVSKEKASRIRRPAARAHCDARRSRGLAKLASLKQRQPSSGCTCASRLLITAGKSTTNTENKSPQERAMARSCGFCIQAVGLGNLDFPLCMRRAAQQRADQGGRCLSEASLDRPRSLRAAQVARSEAKGRRQWGRLSFAYFSLATQRKVSRPPGRHPGKGAHSAQDPNNQRRPPGRDPACPAGHAPTPTPVHHQNTKSKLK